MVARSEGPLAYVYEPGLGHGLSEKMQVLLARSRSRTTPGLLLVLFCSVFVGFCFVFIMVLFRFTCVFVLFRENGICSKHEF